MRGAVRRAIRALQDHADDELSSDHPWRKRGPACRRARPVRSIYLPQFRWDRRTERPEFPVLFVAPARPANVAAVDGGHRGRFERCFNLNVGAQTVAYCAGAVGARAEVYSPNRPLGHGGRLLAINLPRYAELIR